MMERKYGFNDLVELMVKLRGPGGCAWDREQDHGSLKRYLLEETYEVLEAIDLNDKGMIQEELGDVLLQVVFHAQVASEENAFDIDDVVDGICRKIISRHTHVFGEDKAETPEEVLKNWNRIKYEEKKISSHTAGIKSIPKNFPALFRSMKIQEKAARAGFDWDDRQGPVEKIKEEIEEFLHAYDQKDGKSVEEEFGDILFSLVNLSRFLKINPELALEKTMNKFIRRFSFIEEECLREGLEMENMSLSQLDVLWEKSKEKDQ
ncbi:MAG: nucleoside triphosphate pyrophosphohydrolase [Clostridia bacterium]